MERNIVRTIAFATIVLGAAGVVSAEDRGICSYSRVAGEWGYTDTGTLILPTGPVPFAMVGRYTLDADGNFSGTQTSSRGGITSEDTINGTATVNADCTGTFTVNVYDQSGHLLRTAVWALVYVDSAREVRAILTSLVQQPSGTSVPAVATDNAKKLFPGSPQEQHEQ